MLMLTMLMLIVPARRNNKVTCVLTFARFCNFGAHAKKMPRLGTARSSTLSPPLLSLSLSYGAQHAPETHGPTSPPRMRAPPLSLSPSLSLLAAAAPDAPLKKALPNNNADKM